MKAEMLERVYIYTHTYNLIKQIKSSKAFINHIKMTDIY